MNLSSLGWTPALAQAFEPYAASGFFPARVALEHRHAYVLLTSHGELAAECTGRLLHDVRSDPAADRPAVGDWVALRLRAGEARADIHAVLPRRTKFSRRAVGRPAAEQVVAANVDTVLLVTGLDQNFNLRRIERYLTAAWDSGAQPVVVLNKADLHPDPARVQAEVEAIAGRTPVVTVSAQPRPSTPENPEINADAYASPDLTPGEKLAPWLVPGSTLALLGSSGVGKSTLINLLIGTGHQRTSAMSAAVGKGRHTTTHRALIVAPGGWLLLDTPGMRELQLWDVDPRAVTMTFEDIAALASTCRFRDCRHDGEPGCAVQAALDSGCVDPERWESFRKLQREQAYAARKSDPRLAQELKTQWKKIHRGMRARNRFEGRNDPGW